MVACAQGSIMFMLKSTSAWLSSLAALIFKLNYPTLFLLGNIFKLALFEFFVIEFVITVTVTRLKLKSEFAEVGQSGKIVTLKGKASGETSIPRTKSLFTGG